MQKLFVRVKQLVATVLLAILSIALLPTTGLASSHMDAPLITLDPAANTTDVYAFVNQDSDSFRAKQVGNQRGVGPMVVVSEDGVNAVTRFQTAQHLGARSGVTTLFRDVVAGQGDYVGLQPVCGVDRPFDLFAIGKRAVVYVGKLDYAKTVEGLGKSIQVDAFMLDREHVRLGKRSAGDVRQTDRE